MRLTISYNSNFILEFLHLFLYKVAHAARQLTSRLNVDILGMLFLSELFKAKRRAVLIDMSEHMCILISSQPFIFPVKSEWFACGHQLLDHLVILHAASVEVLHILDHFVLVYLFLLDLLLLLAHH
jgi:hypothetical protein